MLSITGLDYAYGSQILFDDASLKVETGWKVGLIGPNGSGKSTLFRLVTGEEVAEIGDISMPNSMRLGYFNQSTGEMSGCDSIEQTIRAAGRVGELRGELTTVEELLATTEGAVLEKAMDRYARLQNEFQTLGGYEVEARAKEVLAGLGFSPERMRQDVGELSGGWKMRVSLAGILIQEPDLLLLDEPTNHLDLESILWLEGFIRDYPGTVVMTCHDHEFMNQVVNRIVEIDEGKLRLFPGDYDLYLAQRELEDVQRQAAFVRQQSHIDREMKWINTFRAKARKASAAQSRLKRLNKLEKVEPPRSRRQRLVFRIPEPKRSGNDIFVAEDLDKAYGELIVFLGLDVHVRRGERWAVLGVNGAGKTTLLKIMLGEMGADSGKCKLGVGLEVGYFAQHTTEQLHPDDTVLEVMTSSFPAAGIGNLRSCLACFGFDPGDLEKATRSLSGGEKARLVLARMLFEPPNFLVLDEPTNHLDVESKQALLDALGSYKGTMVFVSHDRHFLESLATHVLELENGSGQVWHSGYRDYVESSGHLAPGT